MAQTVLRCQLGTYSVSGQRPAATGAEPGTPRLQSSQPQIPVSHRVLPPPAGPLEEQEEQRRLENQVEEIMIGNFPDMGEEKGHTSTEDSKQEEPKKTHTKTQHNYNGKH